MSLARRVNFCALSTFAWLALACLMTSAAFAASTYTEATPAPGSFSANSTPLVSVKVSDPAGIWMSGAQIKIDGRLKTPRQTWGPGNAYVILSYKQTTPLSNGTHTAYASVFTGAGRTSYFWTFTVGAVPVMGEVVPADGSTVDTQSPTITARLISNGNAVTGYSMTLDGASVSPVYDAGTDTLSYTPTSPLANGVEHDVTVEVGYASGHTLAASTTFGVQIYPQMTESGTCGDCHAGYPSSHPVDDCLACHGAGGPFWTDYDDPADSHAPGTGCANCHGDLSDCGYCHDGPYPTVPRHAADLAPAHAGTGDASCTGCHLDSLTLEHNRHTDDAGTPYTCLTCHASTDAIVVTAIASGSTSCVACHTFAGSGGHESLHTLDRTDTCVDCHQGGSLTTLHLDAGLACDTCHASTDPDVLGAIQGHERECGACHTAQGTDFHAGFDSGHTFSGMDAGCQAAGCHVNTLVEAHASLVGVESRYPLYSDTCALCHVNADESRIPAGATADCSSCHDLHGDLTEVHAIAGLTGSVDLVGAANPANAYMDCQDCHGPVEEVVTWVHSNGAGAGANVDCRMCHEQGDLLTLHAGNCSLCHGAGGPRDSFSVWNQTCQQGDCHPTLHPDARAGHDLVDCYACHDHLRTFEFTTDRCGTCHTLNDIIAPTTTSNTLAYYSGPATIAFSSSDEPAIGGSGVAHTYYRLDGGLQAEGSALTVPQPVSGSQLHALEFWSVDGAGNVEVPKVVTFTVISGTDATPPSGTMSINNGASYALVRSVTVNSQVTDAETAVWQMRVDPGTGTFGSWLGYSASQSITLPLGTGTKTVRVEYKDYGNNVRQLTDTIMLDSNSPVTTSDTLASYTGPATITLSATDVGSGVAHTYYRLDGGPQTEGTTIDVPAPSSGSAEHTLEYWSVDNAGRHEVVHRYDVFVILAADAQVGVIAFTPNYANEIDWYDWEIRDSGGALVASGTQDTPLTMVPVSAQPYSVTVDYVWYGEPMQTATFDALIDSPGDTAYIVFN